MAVGRVEFLRRQEAPPLVCVEPAQLPQEGVLAARVLSRVLQPADKTGEPHMTSRVACTTQLTNSCRRGLVHLMSVSHDIELPAEVVKTAQEGDEFCRSLKPGTALSKSEYFEDQEVLIF